MEEREGTNNNNTASLNQAAASSDAYPMDPPRPDNPNPFSAPPITSSSVENAAAPQFSLTMPASETASSEQQKKRRGRPRKYNPDGTLAVTLSPMPISSSVPLTSGLPPRKRGRGRGRSSQWLNKSEMFQFDRSPAAVETSFAGVVGTGADFVGANFTPHMITVNAGEDVTMKIMTFSQQGSRAICILSANGLISNVTLRQTNTSGGTLTYEGRFEILSLTGLFMQNDTGGTRSRAGGMSVCLAGPDGRVFGGGLAGLFLAAGPVQVMVATFIAAAQEQSHLQLAKERRQRFGAQPPSISFNITAEERKARFERLNNSVTVPAAAPTPSYNAVHSYYTNSVNHVSEPFSSIQRGEGGGGGGGEEEGEEDEGDDDDDLEGEEDGEFGGDSQSDNEIPS